MLTPRESIPYDELDRAAQTELRALWEERFVERLASLNFEAQFEADGRSWAELVDGAVVVRNV